MIKFISSISRLLQLSVKVQKVTMDPPSKVKFFNISF